MLSQTVIDPHHQRDFVIRSTVEEPSGNVDSILYKRHMKLLDRGMYKCQDVDALNTYSVWVTVLECEYNKLSLKWALTSKVTYSGTHLYLDIHYVRS